MEPQSLSKLSVSKLKALALHKGISIIGFLEKNEIISALEAGGVKDDGALLAVAGAATSPASGPPSLVDGAGSSGHGDVGSGTYCMEDGLVASLSLESFPFCWRGPFLHLENFKGGQDLYKISTEFAAKLITGRKPEQYLKRESGRQVPLKPASSFMLLKIPRSDLSHAFLLLSINKQFGATLLSNRIEAFYNGQIMNWQHWS
jgi:hypothetical protein